jgi:hypothetical protein
MEELQRNYSLIPSFKRSYALEEVKEILLE